MGTSPHPAAGSQQFDTVFAMRVLLSKAPPRMARHKLLLTERVAKLGRTANASKKLLDAGKCPYCTQLHTFGSAIVSVLCIVVTERMPQ